jgi:hypothetical protein
MDIHRYTNIHTIILGEVSIQHNTYENERDECELLLELDDDDKDDEEDEELVYWYV